MNNQDQEFDLFNSPLTGINLIAASAGTGKTYTIAHLFTRLVVEKKIPVSKILVVTFTDAATKELRDRIRTRLAEAARFFRDEIPAPDTLVAQLRDQFTPEQWAACAGRLDIAAQ